MNESATDPRQSEVPLDSGTLGRFRETRRGWLIAGAVWLASAAYLGLYIREGWIPWDSGALAEMASRALQGQVPYRDFVEIYTGGLTYLNALSFRLFGASLLSLRIPLFLFFLAWVPSLYFICRRFLSVRWAALVTLLSVVWSVPNYPEAVGSWYNLFFATWGTLALLRYTETERNRWLLIAGLLAGLSFLVKVSGVYFVAAVLLFFVFRAQLLGHSRRTGPPRSELPYRLFATMGLLLFLAAVASLTMAQPTVPEFVYVFLPSAFLVAFLVLQVWAGPGRSHAERFRTLFGMALPFLAASMVPVVLFLLWLASHDALGDWFRGVFVASQRHMEWATHAPPSLALALALVPVLLVLLSPDPEGRATTSQVLGGTVALAVILVASRYSVVLYADVGELPVLLVPILALGLLLRLGNAAPWRQQRVFLVTSVAVVCALVEFPYVTPIYFCYVAPLAFIAAAGFSSSVHKFRPRALGALVLFYLAFALWLRTPAYCTTMNTTPLQRPAFRTLKLARGGGLRVRASQATVFERLVPLVRAHARGAYVYCTPDCPEVYFLSGKLNPTGTIYDYLDPDFLDPVGRVDRILDEIQQHGAKLVVLAPPDPSGSNSGSVAPFLREALDKRFPEWESVGGFEVRWR